MDCSDSSCLPLRDDIGLRFLVVSLVLFLLQAAKERSEARQLETFFLLRGANTLVRVHTHVDTHTHTHTHSVSFLLPLSKHNHQVDYFVVMTHAGYACVSITHQTL